MSLSNVVVLPGRVEEASFLRGILARWLRVADAKKGEAPIELIDATRLALIDYSAPRLVIQVSAGKVQSVHTSLAGVELHLINYDESPDAIANTQGLVALITPR